MTAAWACALLPVATGAYAFVHCMGYGRRVSATEWVRLTPGEAARAALAAFLTGAVAGVLAYLGRGS